MTSVQRWIFWQITTMVDSNKIGILGICGFGGFALNAAAMDTRIKAIVTSSMYDIPRNAAHGYFDKQDSTKDRLAIKESLNTQRTKILKPTHSQKP